MEYCKGGDLFKNLMMKGGTLDEAWVCTEVRPCRWCKTPDEGIHALAPSGPGLRQAFLHTLTGCPLLGCR